MKRAVALGVFAVATGLSFVLALWRPSPMNRLLAWGVVAVGVTAAAVGLATRAGSLTGAITDETNRYSQPALITLCWFVLVVSAYLACALWNVAIWNAPEAPSLPLAIDVPASLWVLAGIVGTDLAGTALIRLRKKQRSLIKQALRPELGDLTSYDEAPVYTDPAQLQKLLFQIAAVIAYGAALGRLLFLKPVDVFVDKFPAIPEGFLALLGVSTGVALVNRSIRRQ